MKTILMFFFTIIYLKSTSQAFSNQYCKTAPLASQDSLDYKVYKIDSINNYYIIYARNKNIIFKIISQKVIRAQTKIIVGNNYKFQLHSILSVNGRSIIPSNQIHEISGWRISNSTTIPFEGDSIRDLFYADNIKGLYFGFRTSIKSLHPNTF